MSLYVFVNFEENFGKLKSKRSKLDLFNKAITVRLCFEGLYLLLCPKTSVKNVEIEFNQAFGVKKWSDF